MSSTFRRAVSAFGLLASLLAMALAPTLAQQGHNPFPATPAGADLPWQVTGQTELAIDGELVALSPDGQWIAGIGAENELCVWEVATLDAACDPEGLPPDPRSLAWSPGSDAVAWSLDALRFFRESDIFVFALDAGESVNLTDDGFDGGIPLGDADAPATLPIDIFPAWTPDGDSLIFARTNWEEDQPTTELMTMGRDGGEPESLFMVRDDYPLAVAAPLLVLDDGAIVFSEWVTDEDDPGIGLWLLDRGEATQLLAGGQDDAYPFPAPIDAAERDGQTIVSGYSQGLLGQFGAAADVSFEIDIETGELTPVHVEGGYMIALRYSPDGTSSVSLEFAGSGGHAVILSAAGRLDLGEFLGGRYTPDRGLDWAENDTILIPDIQGGGTLIAVGRGGEPSATPIAATPVAAASREWTVASQQELDIAGQAVTLSPDGQWIAGLGPDRQLCVWEVATLEVACDDQEFPIQEDAIRWAPDSSAVAYSLDALRMLYDSDIFVFEVATGESMNLTDDGFADTLPFTAEEGVPAEIPVDILPAWTPDSQSLVFTRTVWIPDSGDDDQPTTDLFTIDRGGGEPELIATVRDDYAWAIFQPMAALEDGSVLYTISVNDLSDPGNGLWLLGADGEMTQLMPGADDADYPAPGIVDVRMTDDGLLIAGVSAYKVGMAGITGEVAFLLDTASGEAAPVPSADDSDRASSPVRFSPDGTATIGIEWPGDEPHLVIRDGTGVSDLGRVDPTQQVYSRGIEWVANNTLLVVNADGAATLLTLTPVSG